MSQIIAHSIYRFIKRQLIKHDGQRKFFRVDGFEDAIYRNLIQRFHDEKFTIGDYSLVVRSTGLIEDFELLTVEQDKSATWYRNHVDVNTALILLFNRVTTDAQSLKDLYTITESTISVEGFDDLLTETFSSYMLLPGSTKDLKDFITRVERNLFKPQLRDLADFLEAIHQYMSANEGVGIQEAIAESLPALGLFRCRRLASVMDRTKTNRLLRDIYSGSRLGAELLNDRQLADFRHRLQREKDNFSDETAQGGISAIEKVHLIEQFLTTVVHDAHIRRRIYSIDWDEIVRIVHKAPPAKTKATLQILQSNITESLTDHGIELDELVAADQRFIQQFTDGEIPNAEDIERFLDDYGDMLYAPVKKKLHDLTPIKTFRHADFMVAVTQAVLALAGSVVSISDGMTFLVKANDLKDSMTEQKDREALRAFKVLYGGIDQLMPSINWNLSALWTALVEAEDITNGSGNSDDDQRLLSGKVELSFSLSFVGTDGQSVPGRSTEIVWIYNVDGPQAISVTNLFAEQVRMIVEQPVNRIPIPLYQTTMSSIKVADFDLSRPLRSIGIWYDNPQDLRQELLAALSEQTTNESLALLDRVVLRLERTWMRFIDTTLSQGVLAAPLEELLYAYQKLIDTAGEVLQSDQEHVPGLRTINRAWLVGPQQFDDWAIVPFVHPLKLQWWQSRATVLNHMICRLCDPQEPASAVDQDRLMQEIDSAYTSTSIPAVLALPYKGGAPDFYLPVQEFMGYELYRISSQAGIAHGFAPELTSAGESDQAVKQAASALAAVIEDYVETYPFVRDGLEIYIINCRNGALPGALVEQISRRLERNNTRLRLNIIVHTDRGAPIYEHVTKWLTAHEEFETRFEDSFFPRISLKVRQCTIDELLQTVEDTDMVILPDVIAERGQQVQIRPTTLAHTTDSPYHMIRYGAYQAPHQQKEYTRDIILTHHAAPKVHQSFYQLQDATYRRGRMQEQSVEVALRVTLQDWQHELKLLHKEFNWVVCYDAVVDRFLLEATFPNEVDVIRYSLGLGPKRRHNLTVSSSNKTRAQVQRRLMGNLKTMFGSMAHTQHLTLAEQLIIHANRISGDIVLRAAGPGAFLNELIGMVAAYYDIERTYHQANPKAFTTWIYLEDFSQWFKKRLPDLVFVAITSGITAPVHLHIQVIETKCVGQTSFPNEAREAREQVIHGLNRLAQVWQPGAKHLDASYWYDQLYQALVGTISLPADKVSLWNTVRDAIPIGQFELDISAHTYVFCHDGTLDSGLNTDTNVIRQKDGRETVQCHHYSRDGLRKVLSDLINTSATVDTLLLPVQSNVSQPSTISSTQSNGTVTHPSVYDGQNKAGLETKSTDIQSTRVTSIDQSVQPTAEINPLPLIEFDDDSVAAKASASDEIELASSTQDSNDALIEWMKTKGHDVVRALRHYSISINPLDVQEADIGPSIVRFKLRPRPGEKLSRIQAIAEDLQRELALSTVPLIDNIAGTNYIGLDIPRPQPETAELLASLDHLPPPEIGQMPLLAGKTPNGDVIMPNLTTMPHMLVAGSTGSGKTVFLYSIIVSLLHQFGPEHLQLLLIDPKQTDFVYFENIPHLFEGKVVLEATEAIEKLKSLTTVHLEERTTLLRQARCRDIQGYNTQHSSEPMRPIVVIIDEYADLVQVLNKPARQEFEMQLVRLAQRARNVGIHLVIATQRPSADVLTTTLKTNLPTRVAFRLPSHHDSQIVIDRPGAENLLGKGDMLLLNDGQKTRLQGLYIRHDDLETWLTQQSW
ncbi:DNA translocase FtsK [Herpetosiphon llansteffanensis]|uniref:DNA translocase FtsK n=1 Tax=Herpetosiphon llansteffanensis TaxID=2094568 RepID=UPI0013DFC967|nr:DNA translocase FtsK [Herpetosiphon llansteffanensis]